MDGVGEAPHDDPLLTEPLEQLRRILGPHQPEQKCAADDLQSRVGKQRLEPEDGLRQQTARLFPPIGVGQCGPPHGESRARDRPGPKRRAGLVGDAHAVWADIYEGLIDQEQAAAPPQTIGEAEQGVPAVDVSIGVVGIDDNGNAGLGELADLGDLETEPASPDRPPHGPGTARHRRWPRPP